MTIHIMQQVFSRGTDWWDWSVWLEGGKSDLDVINQVTYTLHPTFPNPVVTISDRKTGFRLDSSGWGEFKIYLQIEMKDGQVMEREHYLRFIDASEEEGRDGPTTHSAGAAKELTPRIVFVSGGTRDIDMVQAIRNVLSKHGFKVTGAEDIKPGQDSRKAINSMIEHSVAAVFVVSGRTNLWMNEEINVALRAGVRHILPVVVGPDVDLPEALHEFQSVRADNPADLEKILLKYLYGHQWGK